MFDLYLIHIIGNAVRYYRSERTLFDPLLPHISPVMRDRMWATLQSTDVSFDAAYNARTAKRLPLITVESSEQFYDEQGLAQLASEHLDDDQQLVRLNHVFTSQEAVVNIYADTLETVRLLSLIVQAGMLTFKDVLVKAAFQNVIYIGATSLVPDPAFTGEDLSTYGRQMRFAALHLLEIPSKVNIDTPAALDPLFTIQVQHESQTAEDSTINGGVSV
jgi:hypothetical protein